MNKLKLGLALVILAAGIYGYYQLPVIMGQDVSVLLQFAVLAVAIVIAAVVAATSESGSALIEFSKGSRMELKKMVWPSRQETTQTTIIIMVMVVLVSLFLWLIDITVFEVIYDLLLGVDS